MEVIRTIDENGFPLFLANVPNSGASTVDPDAASGNPQHDTASGKFGKGSAQGDPVPEAPANTQDVQAYLRQLDAVRDLAREMDDVDAGDIQDFLAGRLKRPLEQAELDQFLAQVRLQRVNDLVDMLDYQFRGLIAGVKTARRKVKVSAPRGWTRKVFNGLSDDEVLSVINRLEARGHSREDLSKTVLGRIRKKERADAIGARLADIPENDNSLELAEMFDDPDLEDTQDSIADYETLLSILEKKNEQPIIVNVNVENKPTKKIIKRDKHGNIETIEETD